MNFLNYKGKDSEMFQGLNGEPMSVSMLQYIAHYAYGANEQTILKLGALAMNQYEKSDSLAKKKLILEFMKKLGNTSSNGNSFLPHGIVLSRNAAFNVLDFVYYVEGFRGARIAAGPCICQLALKRNPAGGKTAEIKDLTLYYGADIYTDLPLGHYEVTADEAKAIVQEMFDKGYVRNVMYMFGKRAGTFVRCNCDDELCAVVKGTRVMGPGLSCEKGPEIIRREEDKCLGPEKCGMCIKRCPFGCNSVVNGKIVFDREKCMGCELCVSTCKGCARALEERKVYAFDNVMNRNMLLAGKYGYPRMEPVKANKEAAQ